LVGCGVGAEVLSVGLVDVVGAAVVDTGDPVDDV
jgi:hypothetical protein